MADEVESVKSSGKSDFLDKFRGKTNKISKLGVNAILLKGSIENMEADYCPSNSHKISPLLKDWLSINQKRKETLCPLWESQETRVVRSLLKLKINLRIF